MPMPIYVKILLWSAYLISLFFAIFWFLVLMDSNPKLKRKKLTTFLNVTIAVPAYNEENNIIQTLNSLIRLNYPKNKLEIIVVNDGSTDKTPLLVERFIKQNTSFDIKLINKINEGKGAALNKALSIAKGKYFVCLDADSTVKSNILRKTLPHFADEEVAVVLPLLKVKNPKTVWQKLQWLEYIINMFYKKLMSKLDCVHVSPGPFSVYKTNVLRNVGGFDEHNLTEDLEISLRLQSRNFKIVQILEGEVFTKAPKSFKDLYKQRNRWYKGSIINAFKYKHMMLNRKFGDFGLIQMPTIIISGIIAVILVASSMYYGLKPYVKGVYNSFLIDFDIYTLLKTFKLDFNWLDINYMVILVALVTFTITITLLKKSQVEIKENARKHGIFNLLAYLFLYFFVIGFIWIGILIDLVFGKKQKW